MDRQLAKQAQEFARISGGFPGDAGAPDRE